MCTCVVCVLSSCVLILACACVRKREHVHECLLLFVSLCVFLCLCLVCLRVCMPDRKVCARVFRVYVSAAVVRLYVIVRSACLCVEGEGERSLRQTALFMYHAWGCYHLAQSQMPILRHPLHSC